MSTLVVSSLLAALVFAPGTLTLAQGKLPVCLRMEGSSIRPIVRAYINGKGPFRFLIDTGADGTARVHLRIAEQLKLRKLRAEANDDSTGMNTKQVDVVHIETLGIGNLVVQDIDAKSRDYGKNIDGILAFGLFAGHLLTLDYAHRVVLIAAERSTVSDGLSFENPQGTPVVLGRLGQQELKIDVDTGDDGGLTLPTHTAEHLTFLEAPKVVGHGVSATHEFEVREARVKEDLQIGSETWHSPVVRVSELFGNVNLGSGMLSALAITVDQQHKTLRLFKPKAPVCDAPPGAR